MRKYVDGFVVPVPKKKLTAYRKMSRLCGKVWREHGALEYVECVGDAVPKGKVTSFPLAVQLKASEVAIFSWISYKSKAHRNQVNKKAMQDPRLAHLMNPKAMPFDGKRLIMGGFKPIIDM